MILNSCARQGGPEEWWSKMHVSCSGSLYVPSLGVDVRCDCPCHKAGMTQLFPDYLMAAITMPAAPLFTVSCPCADPMPMMVQVDDFAWKCPTCEKIVFVQFHRHP